MTYSYDKNRDTYYYHLDEGKKKSKLSKGKHELIGRMVAAHRKKKREEKIDDLKDDPKMWKGLQ
jgi:hypothetical protein